MTPARALSPFILKLASRCNLNCSYCYVYNQADTSWRGRPKFMSEETYGATLERIRRHCQRSGQEKVQVVFHGGEPTLVGSARFAAMCVQARERLEDLAEVTLSVQTNGTRLDREWAETLLEHDVEVGVSLDGPKEVNDAARVDHGGRGSHDSVVEGIAALGDAGVPFGILSVVQLGADPLRIHRHFIELGARSVAYLLPSYTHDTIGPVRKRYGSTPCADYLIPIFDEWWDSGTTEVSIREFWEIGRVIMGGLTELDSIGNPPIRFVSVETDGSMHGLDKLRACEDGMTRTALNVHDSDFHDIAERDSLHAAIMEGVPLPTGCRACPERSTCAGGLVAHRYSHEAGFDNPSVWCADLLAIFAHIRARLGVSHEETAARRAAHRELAAVPA